MKYLRLYEDIKIDFDDWDEEEEDTPMWIDAPDGKLLPIGTKVKVKDERTDKSKLGKPSIYRNEIGKVTSHYREFNVVTLDNISGRKAYQNKDLLIQNDTLLLITKYNFNKGDRVIVDSNVLKNKSGVIITSSKNRKSVVVDVDGINHIVSTKYLRLDEDINIDYDDWDEEEVDDIVDEFNYNSDSVKFYHFMVENNMLERYITNVKNERHGKVLRQIFIIDQPQRYIDNAFAWDINGFEEFHEWSKLHEKWLDHIGAKHYESIKVDFDDWEDEEVEEVMEILGIPTNMFYKTRRGNIDILVCLLEKNYIGNTKGRLSIWDVSNKTPKASCLISYNDDTKQSLSRVSYEYILDNISMKKFKYILNTESVNYWSKKFDII